MEEDVARLTRDEVVEIIGQVNDAKAAEIILTGATRAELMEAFTWLSEQGDLSAEVQRAPSGVVGRLCEILTADEPEWANRER